MKENKKKRNRLLFFMGSLLLFCFGGCGKKEYPPSEVIINDVYVLDETENMEFAFSKNSILTVTQKGVYELSENDNGEPLLRICLDDTSRELPEDYHFTEYLMKKEGKRIFLNLVADEEDSTENQMLLFYLKGKDGILNGKPFQGSYQIGMGGDNYQYKFYDDGTITMQITEHYFIKDSKITLTDYMGSTDYIYEQNDNQMMIKNMRGDKIMELHKKEE